jgi:hypothetical protein
MREQRREIGVGLLVIDDEAGIDRHVARIHRMAVAADPRIGLQQCHAVALREQPRRRQAGNAAADDRDILRPDRCFRRRHTSLQRFG